MRYIGNDYEGDMAAIGQSEVTRKWWKVSYTFPFLSFPVEFLIYALNVCILMDASVRVGEVDNITLTDR
jgi:hypothetical protein